MLALLIQSATSVLLLALVFGVLIGAVFVLDNAEVRRLLRRQPVVGPWFLRFEAMSPAQLRFAGMVALGSGVCSFAALLTLRLLFPGANGSLALALGVLTVAFITGGAALLERAAVH